MQSKLRKILFASAAFACFSVQANWTLHQQQSSVHFVSTKNQHISEIQHFNQLQGELSKDGKLRVNIALASIDSGIAIRDTRMQEKLFQVTQFPQASISAQLPESVLSLSAGQSLALTITAELTLLEVTKTIEVAVQVTGTQDNGLVASSIQPILVNAADYGLDKGITVLQNLAGLNSIGNTVPVSVNLVFKAD